MSVHLKSGGERRALDLRNKSLAALGEVHAAARAAEPDMDLVFLGDFNSMGCVHCSPKLTGDAELESVAKLVRTANFSLVPADADCSLYFGNRGTLLDLALISSATAELAAGSRVVVSGACGALGCRALPASERRPPAFEALSDHCPILLDLTDRDLD